MHVIATAGHVDHGKSTLVRALTGMEPDRWAEERRRGMTIDLGYAWTSLPSGQTVAFVDVPGHERFTTNMLAGVGPVPAVLFVVAADSGWAAQAEEHLQALQALAVDRVVLAVTRADLADPDPMLGAAATRLTEAGMAPVAALAVSGVTGAGLGQLRDALDALVAGLPTADPSAPARLWIDRTFTIRGAGTVVTGTLSSGRISVGEELALGDRRVLVRGLQQLGEPVSTAGAVARVAVNLRGVAREQIGRGEALTSPGGWTAATSADVRSTGTDLPRQLVLHIGSAALPVTVRSLGGELVRLRWPVPVPLHVGDRGLLRDPGRRRVLGGVVVLDPLPPSLRRRGSAAARAAQLATDAGPPSAAAEIARRGALRAQTLQALGLPPPDLAGTSPAGPRPESGLVAAAGWWVSDRQWTAWQQELRAAVGQPRDGELLAAGVPRAELTAKLPDPALLEPLLAGCPELEQVAGKVRRRGSSPELPATLTAALEQIRHRLAAQPFAAPERQDLQAVGLGARELGAAVAAGALLRLPGEVVLLPDAPARARELLATLPVPFTLSAARQVLQTTRRVAVPLLEYLDRIGITIRVSDTERRLR